MEKSLHIYSLNFRINENLKRYLCIFFLKSYCVNEASKLILHDCLYDHVKTLDLWWVHFLQFPYVDYNIFCCCQYSYLSNTMRQLSLIHYSVSFQLAVLWIENQLELENQTRVYCSKFVTAASLDVNVVFLFYSTRLK